MSEPTEHWSDCAVHNEPALPAGPCDCGGVPAGDPRDERIAALEAEIARLKGLRARVCPWDLPDDPLADVEPNEPCAVCGMLGTFDAEDLCISGPRRNL